MVSSLIIRSQGYENWFVITVTDHRAFVIIASFIDNLRKIIGMCVVVQGSE